jgi:hypothetical protein
MKNTVLIICLHSIQSAKSQDRVITTAVFFVSRARAAGMADVGVATSTDAFRNNGTPQNMLFQMINRICQVTPLFNGIRNDL